ncbi:PorP/SprF family type IX secretion system membrane protein [Flavobacterium geliluteum]|uniref:Type IX secretion system membrane protein PorP/SprF n=1 Tax=Flavobacterium geliluteum TaxID=2816120 RepID=A0A940X7P6_9FLAO|nr:type IX secretion system membrane protein PorP/SprF [Flavobacterium geliluteum]MBP4136912.1 type IX secretion system membrane protein PorP/SprF [Flavobacterium geliluteum]
MKILKKSKILFLIGLFSVGVNAQQSPLYSQYIYNSSLINPAFMSMDEYSSVNVMYRYQWVGVPGAPKTGVVSFYTPVGGGKTSLGAIVSRDEIGVDSDTKINVLLSQNVRLGDNSFLALGFTTGIGVFKEDNNLLNNVDNDPRFNEPRNFTRGDIGFGINYFSDRFFAGFSIPSFSKIDVSSNNDFKLDSEKVMYFYTGYLFDLSGDLKFRPSVLLKKGNFDIQAEAQANFLIHDFFWIGAGWRQDESILFLTQFQLTPGLKFSYSYDYGQIGKLNRINSGSHEFSLSYRFSNREKIVRPSYF